MMNKATDLVENLGPLEALEMAQAIMEYVINGLMFEVTTDEEKKAYNKLTSIEMQLNELIKENKGVN